MSETSGSVVGQGRPESRLMLACARVDLDAVHRTRILELAAGPVDWTRFAAAVVFHRVVPVAHRCLEATCPELLPPDVRDEMATRAGNGGRRNAVLAAELVVLVGSLEAAGIAVVPLKGPVVATRAYGSLMLRWPGDLDLAVRSRDYHRARDVLIGRGYTEDRIRGAFLRHDGQVSVDLQHRGRLSSPLDLDLPWDRLERMALDDRSVPTLDAEDMLLHLCAHGAKHCWDRLGWVCDVAELCRAQPQIDWDVVARRARTLHLERVTALGLALARDLLDAQLPEAAPGFGTDRAGVRLAEDVRRYILFGAAKDFGTVGRPWFRLRARERLADKAAVAGYFVATWAHQPTATFRWWRAERRRRMAQ